MARRRRRLSQCARRGARLEDELFAAVAAPAAAVGRAPERPGLCARSRRNVHRLAGGAAAGAPRLRCRADAARPGLAALRVRGRARQPGPAGVCGRRGRRVMPPTPPRRAAGRLRGDRRGRPGQVLSVGIVAVAAARAATGFPWVVRRVRRCAGHILSPLPRRTRPDRREPPHPEPVRRRVRRGAVADRPRADRARAARSARAVGRRRGRHLDGRHGRALRRRTARRAADRRRREAAPRRRPARAARSSVPRGRGDAAVRLLLRRHQRRLSRRFSAVRLARAAGAGARRRGWPAFPTAPILRRLRFGAAVGAAGPAPRRGGRSGRSGHRAASSRIRSAPCCSAPPCGCCARRCGGG